MTEMRDFRRGTRPPLRAPRREVRRSALDVLPLIAIPIGGVIWMLMFGLFF